MSGREAEASMAYAVKDSAEALMSALGVFPMERSIGAL
ncbi:hypothetical protein MPLB_1870015 [Mesorhizobium sp. ORS 3324]|nr:hypothetical protein MPLB_1870015 [Mesorhizobium sp. ORS 3324]